MNTRRTKVLTLLVSVLAAVAAPAAIPGTVFTYQGQVKNNGVPLSGVADFRFTLWDHPTNSPPAPPMQEVLNVDVVNGLFTVELDFGSSVFTEARWLGIEVRHPAGMGGSYQALDPRQPITGAPLALFALNANTAGNTYWNANGNDIYKTNSGNVGIGTTSPLYPLDIVADAQQRGLRSTGSVFISKGNGEPGVGLSVSRVTATNPFFLSTRTEIDGNQVDAYSSTLLGSGTTLRLNSNSDGNVTLGQGGGMVGIGVATPQRLLHIGDNTQPDSQGMIRLASRSGTQGSNRVWDIGVPETDGDSSGIGYSFIFDDTSLGTEPEMMIKWGTGAVGIGTTTIPAGVRLAVHGKVLAEEVEVQLFSNWPDYVFEDDYDLMPLPQLEEHIRKAGHLPGVPPAAEVEKNGLAVGAMQTKMMEKVEELTLYVIQINKELESVKAKNAQLEEELAALRGGRAPEASVAQRAEGSVAE